jgi:aminoglycoside phosphotransferase (APT) family kinase protein
MRSPFREPFERLGKAVAALHHSHLRPAGVHSVADTTRSVESAARQIVRTIPELATSVEGVSDALRSTSPLDRCALRVPIHRRLDGHSILRDGDKLGVIDWDAMTVGHPYIDLASVAAHAIAVSIEDGLPSSVTRACIRALTAAYSDLTTAPIQHAALAWHIAAALLVRAGGAPLAALSERWHECVVALCEEARCVVDGRSRYLRSW